MYDNNAHNDTPTGVMNAGYTFERQVGNDCHQI